MEHENEPDELEEITPREVGILIHLIGSAQMADYTFAMKQTLHEVARLSLRTADMERLEGEVALARLDAETSIGAVADWIRRHLPPPECPDGSCCAGHDHE